MRTIVFFDLPVVKATQRREYRRFVKYLQKDGFIMLQESVYVKMSINQANVDMTLHSLQNHKPKEGSVAALTVTERQFAGMDFVVGEFTTDVVQTDQRYIEL